MVMNTLLGILVGICLSFVVFGFIKAVYYILKGLVLFIIVCYAEYDTFNKLRRRNKYRTKIGPPKIK